MSISFPPRPARPPAAPVPTVKEAHEAIECVARLSELYRERREQLAHGVGVTDQQWGVLEEIATEHFMPSLFARRRESSPAAVSKILRQLLEKGFVVAAVGQSDARQRKYSLTAKGRRAMDRLRESRQAAIGEVWLGLPGADLRAFTAFGQTLIGRLERYAASAAASRPSSTKE